MLRAGQMSEKCTCALSGWPYRPCPVHPNPLAEPASSPAPGASEGLPARFSREHLSIERSWRDGLDLLDDLLDDCAQGGDEDGAVYVWAVRAVVQSIRAYEDDTDESIRSALWEDAVTEGEPWAMGDGND
jgi:hypothetical protein